jgi:hypothetical protein
MQTFPHEHYAARRDECLAAASRTELPNAKRRHLDAAAAWQQIIDQLQSGRHTSRVRGQSPSSAGTGLG